MKVFKRYYQKEIFFKFNFFKVQLNAFNQDSVVFGSLMEEIRSCIGNIVPKILEV